MAILFRKLHIVPDEAALARLLDDLAESPAGLRIGFLNAHAINLAWRDSEAARAFCDLDLLLRDGIGMKIALRAMKLDPGLNMNGTDLIPRILKARGHDRVAIYGTEDPWLSRAADRLRTQGVQIVDTRHGFDPEGHYAERLARTPADVVLLAMGMPKQERVAAGLPAGERRLILCGGAIVDFMAGRVPRAPAWMQRGNLEWLFRLWCEPVRLFDRYVIGNAAFLVRTAFLPGRRPARMTLALLDWIVAKLR
ncbi:WecB/TagA/CpsF family glycosyltransferase [Salipiger sp. IMCC34102]|uniref:WecB/TagA/CpsF family glycosyltransferase n=1 Tax=Salipiger sp. IMCC34102 TaxID=2510647 RepID=UPI001A926E99|nr:WecB/TagA/CpsF family glycosyltransferase [Salipiger sp. IMCC34102]